MPPEPTSIDNGPFLVAVNGLATDRSRKMTTEALQVEPPGLACLLKEVAQSTDCYNQVKFLLVDCRRFLDYNTSHIRSAVNICCSKLVRRRLQENKMSALDLLLQQFANCGLNPSTMDEDSKEIEVILYDHQTMDPLSLTKEVNAPCMHKTQSAPSRVDVTIRASCSAPSSVNAETFKSINKTRKCRAGGSTQMDDGAFLGVLMRKLSETARFKCVKVLKGGFLDFQARYPELCEGSVGVGGMPATPGRGNPGKLSLTSLSQPCLPVSNQGPTRILPFLYLGSQQDAMDQETLKKFGIQFVLNLSISCPQPEFLEDDRFFRIAVNDSYTEKLLPHFEEAFEFLDKVRDANACALVHCLAGISRSPTMAIAYIMRHLHMTSEEAYRYIKEKRPSISPNFNFLGQLLEYEKRLSARRQRDMSEQLRCSMRKVLVPPSPSQKTPSPHSAKAGVQESPPSFFVPEGSPSSARTPLVRSESAEIVAMKRSFSCPVKISRGGRTSVEPTLDPIEQSPGAEVNANGKRQMQPSEGRSPRVVAVFNNPAAATAAASVQWPTSVAPEPSSLTTAGAPERPRGLGNLRSRRGLHIPHAVQEDLPSPSTELCPRLMSGASLTPAFPPPLATTAAAAASPVDENRNEPCPMETDESTAPEPGCSESDEPLQKDSLVNRPANCSEASASVTCASPQVQIAPKAFAFYTPLTKAPVQAQATLASAPPCEPPTPDAGATFVSNPFFQSASARTPWCGPLPSPSKSQASSSAVSSATSAGLEMGEEAATMAGPPLVTVHPATPSKGQKKQQLHAENPFFHSAEPASSSKRPAPEPHPKLMSPQGSGSTGSLKGPEKKMKPSGSIGRALSSLWRRAQASPFFQGAAALPLTSSSGGYLFSPDTVAAARSKIGRGEATADAGGVVRSSTNGSLFGVGAKKSGSGKLCASPTKSKSESALLYALCSDELDSPESGFAESPMADGSAAPPHPYGRDPERESMSSTSSLEIAVN